MLNPEMGMYIENGECEDGVLISKDDEVKDNMIIKLNIKENNNSY